MRDKFRKGAKESRKLKIAVVTIAALMLALSGCSKNNTSRSIELAFGNEVTGNLGPGEAHSFTVKPKEDGMVIVETLGSLATRFEAFDQPNKKLWENRGEGGNAKIVIFVEAGKTYNIKLTEVLTNFEVWGATPDGGPYRIIANFNR